MNTTIPSPPRIRRRGGFTLPEVLITLVIFSLVAGGAYVGILSLMLQSKTARTQVSYIQDARRSHQWLLREVQRNKYYVIQNGGLTLQLYSITNSCTTLRFLTGDGSIATPEDNVIECEWPDGTSRVVCREISLIPDKFGESEATVPLFRPMQGSGAVLISYHVGDAMVSGASERRNLTGPGYQGVEVRLAATPRNLQRWYD
ncbi:MAG: prepilin-type N-terminal cleavage/methylation domain-containing protein [Kiritimatiellae bacterium]|nr:prepilin-type N-terminal cleavage/methylation domain-containing protein [Kiritimatiellia bacterium]